MYLIYFIIGIEQIDPTMTKDHLSSLPRRVLFTLGGLLYAGQLTEVTPPDVYSVTLDKERGHKPHILAREQILTDTVSLIMLLCAVINIERNLHA